VLRHYNVFQDTERIGTLFPGATRSQAGSFRQNDESTGELQRNSSSHNSPDIAAQPINVSNWDSGAYKNVLVSAEAFRVFTIFKNKPLEMAKSSALMARYQNYPPLWDLIHKTHICAQICESLNLFINLQVFDHPERVALMFPGAICDVEPIPREDFYRPVSVIVPTRVGKMDHKDTTALYELNRDSIETGMLSDPGNSEGTTLTKSRDAVCSDATATGKLNTDGSAITTFSEAELNEKTSIDTAASTMSIGQDTEDLSELGVARQDWNLGATNGDPAMLDKEENDGKPLDLTCKHFTV
jgi:hypothetical protein